MKKASVISKMDVTFAFLLTIWEIIDFIDNFGNHRFICKSESDKIDKDK